MEIFGHGASALSRRLSPQLLLARGCRAQILLTGSHGWHSFTGAGSPPRMARCLGSRQMELRRPTAKQAPGDHRPSAIRPASQPPASSPHPQQPRPALPRPDPPRPARSASESKSPARPGPHSTAHNESPKTPNTPKPLSIE